MKFISTEKKSPPVSFKEAVASGLAPDGGLFVPERIPTLDKEILEKLPTLSFQEISFQMAKDFLSEDFSETEIRGIIERAMTFDVPLVHIKDNLSVLELFHGPTLAFKDFGARFLGQVLSLISKESAKETIVLVATSGDTGGAVASGLFNVPGVQVVILYPSGRVSELQERQLTTLGGNITALECEGSFDDCQRLVKQAFTDEELTKKLNLTSANSISVARLIPQMFYYGWAVAMHRANSDKKLVMTVPSGNFGNLTAGLYAKRMGLEIEHFIAAVNANDVVPKYAEHGVFTPIDSIQTISNAMDVGNPSNFSRLLALFPGSHEELRKEVSATSVSDDDTLIEMQSVYKETGYILDPHTSVGTIAAKRFSGNFSNCEHIVLGTAHPGKFSETVEKAIGTPYTPPEALTSLLMKEKKSLKIGKEFQTLKDVLLEKF